MCEISFIYALDSDMSESDVRELLRMMHYGSSVNPHGWGVFSDIAPVTKHPVEFDMTKDPKLAAKYADSKWAIGHVRHATHGAHTIDNTHPLVFKDITLVHNGVIHNEAELRQKFHIPRSPEVDSFVIAWLLNHFRHIEKDWESVVKAVTKELRGSFSVFFFDRKEKRLFYFRDTSEFHFRLIETSDGKHYIVGNTTQSSLQVAFARSMYGFTINAAQTLSYLHPQESKLYEFGESGVMVLCELPSPPAEVTTLIPCDYGFARAKSDEDEESDEDDDDICGESYGRD